MNKKSFRLWAVAMLTMIAALTVGQIKLAIAQGVFQRTLAGTVAFDDYTHTNYFSWSPSNAAPVITLGTNQYYGMTTNIAFTNLQNGWHTQVFLNGIMVGVN
jgi:hypothetical protein